MHFPKFLIQCPTSAAPTVVWLYPTTRPVSLIRKVSVRSFQTHHRLNPLFNEQKQKDSTQDTNIKPSRANEILEAVLYGSKKVKEIEQQTHSKMLARGKYVHELQIHRVKPDKVDEYIELVSKHLPKIANDPLNEVNLCGSWSVDIGEQDTFIHIWEYKGYPGRRRTHENLQTQKDHRHYSKKLKDLVRSRENHIMLEFSFWQTSPPKVTNGIFELRKYNLKPGRLLEWEMNWRKGLKCRSKFCEPVGAWFTQLGELNTVYHMWTYPDLQKRKITREQAWETPGWADTVYRTVRLVDHMEALILKPLKYSPLR